MKFDLVSPSPLKPREEKTATSTTYNDRLVSSTPVLTAEERQRHQQLQRREAALQHELTQLKQRYDLLQVCYENYLSGKVGSVKDNYNDD